MKQTGLFVLLLMVAACGPNPDDIVKEENKKLTDLEPVEAVKVEEAMSRIRYESEIIAKGGVLPTQQDTIPADTMGAAEEPATAPVSAPAATPATTPRPAQTPSTVATTAANQRSFPHQIQLGAFTTAEAAKSTADIWETRGYSNVIHMENPNATTEYRFVVRLTGFQGYSAAFAESQKINTQFGIRSYPIQIRP
jgi:cell division septation protein DedD